MTKSATEINDLVALIVTSTEEQSSVTEEINRNMAAIQAMVHVLNQNDEATVNDAQ